MPQNSRRVSDFDLRHDMLQYYRHSMVTYMDPKLGPLCAQCGDFQGNNDELQAFIHILKPDAKADWTDGKWVPLEVLDFVLPPLGLVQTPGGEWRLLQRVPARRMRKGYNAENVNWGFLDHPDSGGDDVGVCESSILKQVWYGNTNRINNNVVVWGKGIYYMTDKVATIDDEGNVLLIPNKEKLGEFVCKALANNWDLATSKHSVRTLPSCVPTPLA